MQTKKEQDEFDFENSLKRIEEINNELSESKTSLEKSISLYSEGIELVKRCKEVLNDAKKRIDEASEND